MSSHRIRPTAAGTLLLALVGAGLLVAPPSAPAAGAPTCGGRQATLVGPCADGTLTGTPDRDVVLTNGAQEVDTLGGDDLVCVTGSSGGLHVDTGAGDDFLDLTERDAGRATAPRGAPEPVTAVMGEGDDYVVNRRGSSYTAATNAVISMGDGADEVLVDDYGQGGSAVGTLRIAAGRGIDHLQLDTVFTVDLVDEDDGDVDLAVGQGTAEVAGRTELELAGFDRYETRSAGDAIVNGSARADVLTVLSCSAVVKSGPGSDTVRLFEQIGGFDEYACKQGPRRVHSGAHNDLVKVGTLATDVLPVVYGGSGADVISGRKTDGGDAYRYRAYGEDGNDRLVGGSSSREGDVLAGGPGNDVVHGYGGPDRLYGGTGRDLAYGGTGRDTCAAETRRGCEG